MNVRKICGLGYFDRLIVDGYMIPIYNAKGIEIKSDESLKDAIETNKQVYYQGIGKLKINICGETINSETYEEILRMREHRENELMLKRNKLGTTDRYIIGYVDILILKSDYLFPEEISNKGKTVDDIIKLAKGENELKLLLKALEIQQEIIKKDNGIDDCNIAILDKIYIDKEFRRCGIASWVHNNIGDISKIYGMIDIAAVLLTPGDFADEAEKVYNITTQSYTKILEEHYLQLGYKNIGNDIMCKKLIKNKRKHFLTFN